MGLCLPLTCSIVSVAQNPPTQGIPINYPTFDHSLNATALTSIYYITLGGRVCTLHDMEFEPTKAKDQPIRRNQSTLQIYVARATLAQTK